MTPTLEESLAASIALAHERKTAPRAEAAPPGPASEDQAARRGGELILMPKPPPDGSDIPAVLSPSTLNMFLDCSAKWLYKKLLKLPDVRGAALGLGTAVHAGLIENFRQKIETKEDLPTEGVLAVFVSALTQEMDTVVLQKDESWDDLKEVGEVMTRVYMDQAAPSVQPVAVEERIEGVIGGVRVHGYIDIRDVNGDVIDIKTAKKKPAGTMQSYRTQVATYALLHPQASGRARLSTLTKTRTVALHQDTIDITPADVKLTERLYSIAMDQMQAGLYSPNRNSFLCSKKYCSFHARCVQDYGGTVSE